MEKESLQEVAREMRADIVKSIFSAGSGHPGGSLSAADLLAVLFFVNAPVLLLLILGLLLVSCVIYMRVLAKAGAMA